MKRDFVEERRGKIIAHLNDCNRAAISELAQIFRATEATIRRDLAVLDERGLVYRVHGGALRREKPSVWQITSLHERMEHRSREKERIAEYVASLVNDGDSIMIDSGSTTMMVAQRLRSRKNLLVVTNAPALGPVIAEDNSNKIILTGGELVKETSSLIGNAAENSLRQYRTDKAIFGVSGLLVAEGCFAAIPQEAEIKRLMSTNSSQTIVVADSSKFETRAFCFVFSFGHVDHLVTDSGVTRSMLHTLRDSGVDVVVV
jgi:DeoR/GlpR family transcriptional regulator of sugar metabolism